MKEKGILDKILTDRRATRREFMSHAVAAGVAAGAAASMWSGRALASEPKKGGTLRQALRGGATSDSLDGAALIDSHNINVSWQVRNNLTEVQTDGTIKGELVEDDWDPGQDASQWTFKLKKGVEFHNGKSLEAQDIVDSINHHRGEDASSGGSGAVSGIEDIRADGKETVVFNLKSGNADFPYLMADYHLTIAPAGTTDYSDGMGTGPFVLQEYEPGVRAHTKRNPNYFKEGQPYFDEVETLNVPDVAARISALQTGSVDAIEDPDLKTLHLLEKKPGVVVLEASGNKHFSYPMLTTKQPYDDNNVRMAIKYGVDREKLMQTMLRGHGYIGNDHPIGKGQRYFNAELEQHAYDPDKAKWHLQQSGLDSIDLNLSAADIFEGGVDSAVLMKEHAAPAGININVERVPADGYWSEVWLKKDWCVCYWSGRATEDWMFSTAYLSSSDWNDMGPWKDENFDKILLAARAELDEVKRRDMYYEMQRIVSQEGGVLIPVFANLVCATTDKIGTPPEIAGNWALDGDKNTERWWFV
ncbi:MAG: ABC transporter substrate-binding protein [Pseudomonadota bacterium]